MSETQTEVCASCAGHTRPSRVTLDRRIEGRLVVFEDVPAHVCQDCDEVWLDARVLRAMDKAVDNHDLPTKTLAIPAISLTAIQAA